MQDSRINEHSELMKLIVLTKASFFVEEDKILTSLFEEGLENLHLYKPESEPVYSERLLTLIDSSYYKRITVHDHFYLKEEFNLRGIHLNRATDTPPAGYRGSISRTCHTIAELPQAKKNSDYVFLKTINNSQTNPADLRSFTMQELQDAADNGLINRRVYAMGGMNIDNISLARDLGFGGVVICGDIWNRFNIHNELDYKNLLKHFAKLKKVVE